ncbi:DM13 domain-containing protein [Flagellimonas sp.]|uniref:DM13 domain-containing protein n=1 Tax=Flagellimonas sp. TaxID=2058762 RepID=UPI003F4A25F2
MKNCSLFLMVLAFTLIGCSSEDEVALPNEVPQARDCTSTHPLVGESRRLRVSTSYGISGRVTVISDCEIQLTNFFYNGSGPAVSVYGGTNGNFEDGISLSEPIQGRRFEDETLSVFLPEGTTLDEINSISIWCFQFNIDFSSASFE